MLQILDTAVSAAEDNMLLDTKLLEDLKMDANPILHLYDWDCNSATFGYFIRPEEHLNMQNLEKWGLKIAKRPTGGGVVFHIWDLAFSFLLPSSHPKFSINSLENYQFVNKVVRSVMEEFLSIDLEVTEVDAPLIGSDCQNFCMARPTQYDVVYKGLKIAGAAQRRKKQGYLHQGTISLAMPDIDLLKNVLKSEDVIKGIEHFTFAPLGQSCSKKVLSKARLDLQKLLADKLKAAVTF
jgi:lipoate-protein ligase A